MSAGQAKAWEQCGGEGWNRVISCAGYPCQCRSNCSSDWLCQGNIIESTTTTSSEVHHQQMFASHLWSLRCISNVGSNAFDLDEISFGTSDETPDFASTIVNLIVTVAKTQNLGLIAELGTGLQAESLDERLEAWSSMIELIENILEGSELAAALLENPLLIGELKSAHLLRSRNGNVSNTLNGGPCKGPVPNIGKLNGFYGNVVALREVENGKIPDLESRLRAYYATRDYSPYTVGRAVHRAIGTVFLAFGTAGEEKIGCVFNSAAAKALYNDPVYENPKSFGGKTGAFFKPSIRNCLQRLFSGDLCSSSNRRSLCLKRVTSLIGQQNTDRTSHKGGVWKAGPQKTWGERGCLSDLRVVAHMTPISIGLPRNQIE